MVDQITAAKEEREQEDSKDQAFYHLLVVVLAATWNDATQQRDHGMISVGTPAGLHHIALGRPGSHAGAWPGTLYVNNDARHLAQDRHPQVFRHQG